MTPRMRFDSPGETWLFDSGARCYSPFRNSLISLKGQIHWPPVSSSVRETLPKSLSENSEGRCGEGFWPWPRRRGRGIPAAGCDGRANAGHGQKTRRPEGFRGKGRLASLLLSRRSTRDILPRRASPYGLFRENSTLHNFQTGSNFKILDSALCQRLSGLCQGFAKALPRVGTPTEGPSLLVCQGCQEF